MGLIPKPKKGKRDRRGEVGEEKVKEGGREEIKEGNKESLQNFTLLLW